MATSNISAVGRRKEAIARVRLSLGQGIISVNGKPISEYFPAVVSQKIYQRLLLQAKSVSKYTISVKVAGGGAASQLGAVIHGMARAIAKTDAAARLSLKKSGYLTRDARVKERRKYGHAQKARAKKQSPKR